MSKLKIYKASAGSGKTYTLAKEFLMLLFRETFNYKYILAVTFTNKATAEMKTRIINYLYSLTKNDDPEFMKELKELTGKDDEGVRKQARRILTFILNDFSHFNIETIDSFFQKVIRSFAFEAGLPTNFRIELDNESVLNEAIDTMFKELDINGREELRRWILSQTFSKLQEKGDWRITREMNLLGKEIFKEEFQRLEDVMVEKISDKAFLDRYRDSLRMIIEDFEGNIKLLAGKVLKHLADCGLDITDLKGVTRSPMNVLNKIINSDNLGVDILNGMERIEKIKGPEELYAKTNKRKDDIISCYNSGLQRHLEDLVSFYHTGKENYFTATEILRNIPSLGVLVDISQMVKNLSREQNLFLLSDANQLLNKIIDNNDTPFIYEKTGTRYLHYMIDEFQDTSDLQWANFKPLVINSLSEGNRSLVVGDVKQSIYRWRNSDWQLLGKYIESEVKDQGSETEKLDFNWRSFERIVEFNNFIFDKSAKTLQSGFMDSVLKENPDIEFDPELAGLITNAYDDVKQNVSEKGKGKGGFVEMKFIKTGIKTEYEEEAFPLLQEKIDKLLNAGYEYRDICILVRKKDEGQKVSEYLLGNAGNRYPVISDETLVLESSPAVMSVISRLKFINTPENEILRADIQMYDEYQKEKELFDTEDLSAGLLIQDDPGKYEELFDPLLELKGKPLFEMTEILVRDLPEWLREDQSPYLRELLNRVHDFVTDQSVNLADFIEWWDDKGRTTAIAIPEEQNAIKIMTVHKSKGLEFKAVIIPFCHWDLDRKSSDSLIWCKPDTKPFNDLDLVPVGYTNKLIHTRFYAQFINERLLQFVDNLNILYVAFTRAREALITIGMKKEIKSKPDALMTISDLLIKSIREADLRNEEQINADNFEWDDEALSLKYGEIPVKEKATERIGAIPVGPFKTIPLGSRIRIHSDSNAMQTDILEDYRVHGRIMHLLFEKIKTAGDVEAAIDSLIFEGKLLSENRDKLKTKIEELLSEDPFREWFSDRYKVLNEASILQQSGTSRPDRVLIGDDKVIVIDYKFGQLKNAKYNRQVMHYVDLIKQMDAGYKKVEGYLWYVSKGSELERVV